MSQHTIRSKKWISDHEQLHDLGSSNPRVQIEFAHCIIRLIHPATHSVGDKQSHTESRWMMWNKVHSLVELEMRLNYTRKRFETSVLNLCQSLVNKVRCF